MKPFLLVLLLLSLGANAWLVLARSSKPGSTASRESTSPSPAASGPAQRANPSATPASTAAAASAPQPFVWKNYGHSDSDLRALVSDLRAAGFPADVIVKFIGPLLRERTYARVATLPFWQQVGFGKAYRDETQKASDELFRLQEELLGPDGSRAATIDPFQRQMQFGHLSTAKIDAFLRIDRDYQAIRSELLNANGGVLTPEDVKARNEQMATLERERLADIAAAFGPEDFAAYELRSSAAANGVMSGLRNLTVTEAEYTALVAAQKVKDPNASMFRFTTSEEPGYLERTYAFNDQVRALLGEERAHTYLQSVDMTYQQVARFAGNYPSLTTSQTYALYQLQSEAQAASNRFSAAARTASAPPVDGIQKTMAELNTRLETLLGADAAKAYRAQGPGSTFNAFRPRPAAPIGTTTSPAAGGAVQVLRGSG